MNAYRNSLIVLLLLLGVYTEGSAQFSWKPKPYHECRRFAVRDIFAQISSVPESTYPGPHGIYLITRGNQTFPEPYSLLLAESGGQRPKTKKPPMTSGRILGQTLAGTGGGFLGMLAGAGISLIGGESLPSLFIGMLAGSTIGSSIGVFIAGSAGNQQGSYPATLLGSVLGMIVFLQLGFDSDYLSFYIAAIAMPTLGGIIGFNLTRKYENPPASEGAMIYFEKGKIKASPPAIGFQLNPMTVDQLTVKINLARACF